MKRIVLCSFYLLSFVTFSQEIQTIRIQKEIKEQDFYPQVEGVFDGEIDISKLASPLGITTAIGWKIISYKIEFQSGRDFKTVIVNSNAISEELILELVRSSLKEQVFFTEIMAVDETNTKHLLKSMVLTPIPTDEK